MRTSACLVLAGATPYQPHSQGEKEDEPPEVAQISGGSFEKSKRHRKKENKNRREGG